MQEVRTAFGDSVIFFNNNNRKIDKLDPLRIKTESPTHHVNIHRWSTKIGKSHDSQSSTTYSILHALYSNQASLSEIKNATNVANLMKKYDVYVNEHQWCETDWDTCQLGFLYGIDLQYYDLDQATSKIQEVLSRKHLE